MHDLIRPSKRHLIMRRLGARLYPSIAPAHVTVVRDAISRAEKLSGAGWGILMPFTHFSTRDIVEMTLRPMAASLLLRDKPMVSTIEWSHYQKFSLPRLFASLTGVSLIPIVTEDTLKKGKNYDTKGKNLPLGHGTRDYFRAARHALMEGGIVWVSPQQGRRPVLELSDLEPMKFVLGKENDVAKVAVMFIALSLVNETDYSRRTGLNSRSTFDVRMGPTVTKAELYALARDMGRTIDEATIIVYSHLVDPGYNRVTTDWDWARISACLDSCAANPPNNPIRPEHWS